MPGEQDTGATDIPSSAEAIVPFLWERRSMQFFSQPVTNHKLLPYAGFRKAEWMPKATDASEAETQQNSRNNLPEQASSEVSLLARLANNFRRASTAYSEIGAGARQTTIFNKLPYDSLVLICEHLQRDPHDLIRFSKTCRRALQIVMHSEVVKVDGQASQSWFPFLQTISQTEHAAKAMLASERQRFTKNTRETEFLQELFHPDTNMAEVSDEQLARMLAAQQRITPADMQQGMEHVRLRRNYSRLHTFYRCLLGETRDQMIKRIIFAGLSYTLLVGIILGIPLLSSDQKEKIPMDVVILAVLLPILGCLTGVLSFAGILWLTNSATSAEFTRMAQHEMTNPIDNIRTAMRAAEESRSDDSRVVAELDDPTDADANSSGDARRVRIHIDSDSNSDDDSGVGPGTGARAPLLRPGSSN